MFNKLNWYIAYRYLVSKRENRFVSFIVLISILGVILGSAVLIIVTSVLNGFKNHVEVNSLRFQNHAVIKYDNYSGMINRLDDIKSLDNNIKSIYPLIVENGLLSISNTIIPIKIMAELKPKPKVTDSTERKKDILSNKINIALSTAEKLGLKSGDAVILASSNLTTSIMGPQPTFKKFVIEEVFDNNDERYLYTADIIMNDYTLRKFYHYPENYISSLYVFLKDPFLVADFKDNIIEGVYDNELDPSDSMTIETWENTNSSLFQAIRLERMSILMLLLMIIAIACFNILSGLFIQVSEKQKDLAILRTLGLERSQVSIIFLIQGLIIALLGGFMGVVLGVMVTYNLQSILYWLQEMHLLSTYNSFFNAIVHNVISIQINFREVLMLFLMALTLCLIASIIPARKSGKINLIEVLRDE